MTEPADETPKLIGGWVGRRTDLMPSAYRRYEEWKPNTLRNPPAKEIVNETPEDLQQLKDITAKGMSPAKEKFKFPPTMIEPPSDEDKRHAAANYLHFENENPSIAEIYFDTFDEAVDFVNDSGWSFVTEDWEPAGLFEARIECKNRHGAIVGQLLMLTIQITE